MPVFVGGSYLITSQVHQGEALQRVPRPRSSFFRWFVCKPCGALNPAERQAATGDAPNLRGVAHAGLGTCIFKGLSTRQTSLCCAGRVNEETPSAKPHFHPSLWDVPKRGSHLPSVPHASPQPCSGSPVEHHHLLWVKSHCSLSRTHREIQVCLLSTQPEQLPAPTARHFQGNATQSDIWVFPSAELITWEPGNRSNERG